MKPLAFTGAHLDLGNIMKLSRARTRSITAENVQGEKGRGGAARELTGGLGSASI